MKRKKFRAKTFLAFVSYFSFKRREAKQSKNKKYQSLDHTEMLVLAAFL
jgi:hypothetical protein